MSKFTAVTYQFMFNPSSVGWSNLYQVDDALADFFAAHGLEAEIIEPIKGAPGGRTLFLTPIETPLPMGPKLDERRKQPGSQLKDMAKRELRAPALAFKGKK